MAPYINSPGKGEYSGFRICTSQKMPPLLNSYVTTFVELTLGDEMSAERRTSMRYRDMMVDKLPRGRRGPENLAMYRDKWYFQ